MESSSVDRSNITLISAADLETMEPSQALHLVEGQRAMLLEDMVKDQLKEVQDRNRKVEALNTTLSSARELMAQFGPEDKTGEKISDVIKKQQKDVKGSKEWKTTLDQQKRKRTSDKEQQTQGLTDTLNNANAKLKKIEEKFKEAQKKETDPRWRDISYNSYLMRSNLERGNDPLVREFAHFANIKLDAEDKLRNFDIEENTNPSTADTKSGKILTDLEAAADRAGIRLDINNKGELQTLVENIRSQTDTLSNAQQLDMVRLQTCSSKYNATSDTRTNMAKQEHELKTKILNNTRGT